LKAKDLKIVYMVTPDFAVSCLEGLITSKAHISLVVSQPDRPRGRGLKPFPSPVKQMALKKGLNVITPVKIRSGEFCEKLQKINPDLLFVAAYGKILSAKILAIPHLYPINVHASLLPRYRGAAPINWAIIRGEKKTGITIMKMNEKMDEGDMMIQRSIDIESEENSQSLHDRLAVMASEMTTESINMIAQGKEKFTPQDNAIASYAPMLKKENGLIDWNRKSSEIHDFVRGMNPWPGSFSFLNGRFVKIFLTQIEKSLSNEDINVLPGQITGLYKNSISVKTLDGIILIKELQQESRKRMPVEGFLQGSGVRSGDRFLNNR